MTINLTIPNEIQELKPRITVFGVGGAGGNAVNNMIRANLEGVEFVVTNTDAQALQQSLADRRIQLGATVTQGLGAGSRPEVGKAAAEEAIEEIMEHLGDSNMVFITAGMGGGTGSGAAPVIAQAARENGILTVGVVTKPFHFEGQHRMRTAESGIEELTQYVDTLIIIPNQNLFRVANEKTTFADAFNMADEVLHSGVRGVTDLMVMPGLINLDFADIRTVMSEMGKAMMGTGEASGDKRAVDAAEAAINNPLLEDISMKGAKGVLINITGGLDMTLFEVDEAANRIRDEVDADANIIFGSTFDEKMDGMMRVSVVATGIAAEGMMQKPRPALSLVSARATPPAPAAEKPEAAETPAADIVASETADAVVAEQAAQPVYARASGSDVLVVPETALDEAISQRGVVTPVAATAPAMATATAAAAPKVADAFIAPAPIMPAPDTSSTEPARKADPFREAELANAAKSTPAEGKQERGPSLFQQATGLARRFQTNKPAEAKQADTSSAGLKPAEARGSVSPAPKPVLEPTRGAAAPSVQPRLGALDRADRVTASQQEDDLLDIPAFLRRQAN